MPGIAVDVRLATDAELEAVTALLIAQLREHCVQTPEAKIASAVQALFRHPERGRILIAAGEEGPVGVAALSFAWPLEYADRSAWLEELYVEPAARGRGIGTRLLRAALRVAAEAGATVVDLEVEADHQRAARLYAREGFRSLARTHWVRTLEPVDEPRAPAPSAEITGGCFCGAIRYRVSATTRREATRPASAPRGARRRSRIRGRCAAPRSSRPARDPRRTPRAARSGARASPRGGSSPCRTSGRSSPSWSLLQRDAFAAVAQRPRHPHELLQELVDAREVGLIAERPGLVEDGVHGGEVDVPEDRDQAELAQHGQQVLDAARAAVRPGGHADHAHGLVDVLLQAGVERVLQQARVAVVVLGRDHDQGVGAAHLRREGRVLDRLAGVVGGEGNARDVDQLGLDPRAAGELGHDEPRDREAHASVAHRAEEDGDEERATGLGHEGVLLVGITAGTSARPPTPIAAQKALTRPSATGRLVTCAVSPINGGPARSPR